ncbi:tyrosine-type recombinase/integrase [Pseudactinotalea sp. HY160]|nr:tyrosine-type recombinase/integrase [Pseudactinotalea sp. HY160]
MAATLRPSTLSPSTLSPSTLSPSTLRPSTRRHACSGDWLTAARDLGSLPVILRVDRHGNITGNPLSGHGIAAVVATRATAAGLEGTWGGHSLRAGFITQALRRGATFAEVMAQSGHRNPATVEGYNRQNNPFAANAVMRLGL